MNGYLQNNSDIAFAQSKALANPQMDEFGIEEYVRQWALYELVETYNYPKEWLGERIAVEQPVPVATTDKEADIALKNEGGRPYVFIETKKQGSMIPLLSVPKDNWRHTCQQLTPLQLEC